MTSLLSNLLSVNWYVEKHVYIDLFTLSKRWGQLSEHLCLFWTFTAAERSAQTLGLTCSPLLTPRGSPLPASPEPTCQDTPLPALLLPKPRSVVSSKGNLKPTSLYSAEKKHSTSESQSVQSVHSLSSLGRQTPAPNLPIATSAAEVTQYPIYCISAQCIMSYVMAAILKWTASVELHGIKHAWLNHTHFL